jgi:hypothetical protein
LLQKIAFANTNFNGDNLQIKQRKTLQKTAEITKNERRFFLFLLDKKDFILYN